MPNTAADRLHIVVAIVVRTDGRLLIAQRQAGVHLGGLWEFPGGKLEPGETARQALARELREELGIEADPQSFTPCQQQTHDYGDRHILLDAWWLAGFKGEPCGKEGQNVAWIYPADFAEYAFPAANLSLLAVIAATDISSLFPDHRT